MGRNANLNKAGVVKNDEFYTRIEDIEKEMQHYTKHFKDKVILMPCDDPALMRDLDGLSNDEKSSKFWVFFHKNFGRLGLKKIIATHYNKGGKSYKIEYEGGDDNDVLDYVKTDLEGDGDFRSDEVIEIMKGSDIVVTNPPFSLFREFFTQVQTLKLKFLILGSPNAVSYKEVFPFIKSRKVWCGVVFNKPTTFILSDGSKKDVQINWYTNLDYKQRWEETVFYKKYTPSEYPKYDNYDAININKSKDVPMDYDGVMGVPITFLNKCNPNQFKIIGIMASTIVNEWNKGYPYVDGIKKYARLLIQKI